MTVGLRFIALGWGRSPGQFAAAAAAFAAQSRAPGLSVLCSLGAARPGLAHSFLSKRLLDSSELIIYFSL